MSAECTVRSQPMPQVRTAVRYRWFDNLTFSAIRAQGSKLPTLLADKTAIGSALKPTPINPKTVEFAPKTSANGLKTTPNALKTSPNALKTSTNDPKTSPNALKTSPNALKTSPNALKTSPNAPKTSPNEPKTNPNGPKTSVNESKPMVFALTTMAFSSHTDSGDRDRAGAIPLRPAIRTRAVNMELNDCVARPTGPLAG